VNKSGAQTVASLSIFIMRIKEKSLILVAVFSPSVVS
jgi:hypothetical protein